MLCHGYMMMAYHDGDITHAYIQKTIPHAVIGYLAAYANESLVISAIHICASRLHFDKASMTGDRLGGYKGSIPDRHRD
jgi:hypothetical protein